MGAFTGPNIAKNSLYNYHICTTSGTFIPNFSGNIEVLVVAGGGGGGMDMGGGGGGGGVLSSNSYAVTSGIPITVTVGSGGVGAPSGGPPNNNPFHQFLIPATNGGNSSLGVNLIPDGQFNTGISGWGVYNSSLSWHNNNSLRSVSSSGNPAGVVYYFSTTPGQTYYYKAVVSQSGAISNDARIQISGIGLINSTGRSTISESKIVYDTFTATSSTHILEILLYNSQPGALLTIDDVEVFPTASSLIAIGGGHGGSSYFLYTPGPTGATGGSGGGATGYTAGTNVSGGAGTPGQGNRGGNGGGGPYYSGGGGGAATAGADGPNTPHGGNGILNTILGRNYYWGGGGGGASYSSGIGGNGGLGGGGGGSSNGLGDKTGINPGKNAGGGGGGDWVNTPGGDGGRFTGGGGGGGMHYNRNSYGGNGGSGIIIIRYLKTQGKSTFNGAGATDIESLVMSLDPSNISKGSAVEVLVVAGGGGGGADMGGGGGAGGVIYKSSFPVKLNENIPVIIGGGGSGAVGYANFPPPGSSGGNTSFGTLVAIGGGGGGSGHYFTAQNGDGLGRSGGSGGGDAPLWGRNLGRSPGTGIDGQGYQGGAAGFNGDGSYTAGGGGGANRPGWGGRGTWRAGDGGEGFLSSINGSSLYWAGGGGGAGHQNTSGNGGAGGGGGGSGWSAGTPGTGGSGLNAGGNGILNTSASTGGAGGANTGGGGGGGGHQSTGGAGGSGIVIVRYYGSQKATGGTITSSGGYTIHTFTSSGTFTPTSFLDLGDNLGNDLKGTVIGATYSSNNGGVFVFDGVDDYISIPNGMNALVGTNNVTFSAWVYRTSTPNYWAGIIANKVNVSEGICLLITPDSKVFWQYDGGVSGVYAIFSGQTLSANIWYNIVGVYDNTGLKTYVNGILNDSANDAGKSITSSGNMDIHIGAQQPLGGYFPGIISQVSIYNRALTEQEIFQNFKALRGRYGI
jgi:hypothetical protein